MKKPIYYNFSEIKIDELMSCYKQEPNGIYRILKTIAIVFDVGSGCCPTSSIDENAYRFIPQFYNYILLVAFFIKKYIAKTKKSTSEFKFLDVGCGIGNVCNTISAYTGVNTVGIDLNQDYLYAAYNIYVKLFEDYKIYEKQCEYNKINAFNFNSYKDFNFIYYYCPLRNTPKQIELEHLIEEKMKVGAILFPFDKKDNKSIQESKKFEKYEIQMNGYTQFSAYKKIKA